MLDARAWAAGCGKKLEMRPEPPEDPHAAHRERWCFPDQDPNIYPFGTWLFLYVGNPFLSDLAIRTLLFGVYIRAPDSWKLPYAMIGTAKGPKMLVLDREPYKGRDRPLTATVAARKLEHDLPATTHRRNKKHRHTQSYTHVKTAWCRL